MNRSQQRTLAALLAVATTLGGAFSGALAAGAAPDPQLGFDCRLRATFADPRPGPRIGFGLRGTMTLAVEATAGAESFDGTFAVDEHTVYPVSGKTEGKAVKLTVDYEKGGQIRAEGALADPRAGVCGGAAGTFSGPQPQSTGTWSAGPLPGLEPPRP
jgi:hypothetical protein